MPSQPVITPTLDFVETYISRFDQEAVGITNKTIARLIRAFPNNYDLEDVLLKVVTINSLYATNIYAVVDVAKHISKLQIDSALAQGSLEIVDKIARVEVRGRIRRNYSFASKYCSWHAPHIYPIYDSLVDKLLWAYKEQENFAAFKREELLEYPRYREILDKFREYYALKQFGYKDLDKFLWLYGREMFAPVQQNSVLSQ
ncbi:MAG TPA: hypothetical protein PKC99_14915 [Anaerolineales bacterium]|nr:hypothetical protein [Anaerolineales bacterium]